MGYDTIQFIGHAIHTGTRRDAQGVYQYVGLDDDLEDMAQRLRLLGTVLDVAARHRSVAAEPTTLKVLLLPEFFFRGKRGAYPVAAVSGHLIPGLRRLVHGSQWLDWFFCFGTLASVSADADGTRVMHESLLLRGGFGADAGAAEAASLRVTKTFRAAGGFALEAVVPQDECGFLPDPVRSDPPATPAPDGDGLGVFDACGLRWGVEVCPDPWRPRLKRASGLLPLDVQLIPSCGMPFVAEHVAVAQGWVFHVDGSAVPSSGLQAVPAQPPAAAAYVRVPVMHPGAANLFALRAGTLHVYRPVPTPQR